MKKILILLAFVSVTAYGQIDTVNIGTTGGDGTGDPLRTAFIKINAGLKILDSLQMYNLTSSEMGILSGGTITTTELNYLSGVTSAVQTQINGKLSISDTAAMLAPYALLSETGSGDLSASDTSSMLLPYIREAEVLALGYMALTDTGAMLLPYIREAQVLAYGYLAATDTTAMLLPYIRAAEVAAGYETTGTAASAVSGHESTYNHANYNTAYGWGNHASAGYLGTGDTATMLLPYIREAEVASTYATIASPTFTTSITIGSATIDETELEILDGATITTAELNLYGAMNNAAIDSLADLSATEIEILDGATVSTDELNTLDGISTFASLSAQLELKAPLAGAALTGATTTEALTTDLLTVGTSGSAAAIADITEDGSYIYFYDESGGELSAHISDALSEEAGDVMTLMADTILLFGDTHGYGNAVDTTIFSVGDVLWAQHLEGEHSYVITEFKAVAYGTTPNVDLNWYTHADFRSASGVAMSTADLTVTSTTAGDSTITFSNDTIASGEWIWLKVNEATAQPTQLAWSAFGYKIDAVASSSSTYTAEFQAVYDAMGVKPNSTNAGYYDAFVYSLDTAGYWDMTDLLYVWAVNDNENAELNWISPAGSYNLSDGDSITFTADEGYTGDGNDYMSTAFNLTTDTVNVRPTDSIAIVTYCLTSYLDQSYYFMGSGDYFRAATAQTNRYPLALLNSTSVVHPVASTGSAGLFIFSKIADTASIYLNGNPLVSTTITQRAIENSDILLLATDDPVDGPSLFSQAKYGLMMVIKGIDDSQAEELSTIINTLFTNLGINQY